MLNTFWYFYTGSESCPIRILSRVQIQKGVISDLWRENQFLSNQNMGVYMCMIDISKEICKPFFKLDFDARHIGVLRFYTLLHGQLAYTFVIQILSTSCT
jgi:hypothetical protein